MQIKIKRLTNTAKIPTKAHTDDACYDLYADLGQDEICRIPPHTVQKVHTGIAMKLPDGYWGGVYARSGVATKKHLRPANCVPVIDTGYLGEWLIPLFNDSEEDQYIQNGERIAQFCLHKMYEADIVEVEELGETERGSTGFGDSGKF